MSELQFRLSTTEGTPAGTLSWVIPCDQMPSYPYEPQDIIDESYEHSYLGRVLKLRRYTKYIWPLHFQNVNSETKGTLRMFALENKDIAFYDDVNEVLGTCGTYLTTMRGDFLPQETVRGVWNINITLEAIDSPQSFGPYAGTGWPPPA